MFLMMKRLATTLVATATGGLALAAMVPAIAEAQVVSAPPTVLPSPSLSSLPTATPTVQPSPPVSAPPTVPSVTPTAKPTVTPTTKPAPGRVTSVHVSPSTVVLGHGHSARVTASVWTQNVKSLSITFSTHGAVHTTVAQHGRSFHGRTLWTGTVTLDHRAPAGHWTVSASGTGLDGRTVTGSSGFTVKRDGDEHHGRDHGHHHARPPAVARGARATALSLDARPEPVVRRHKLSLDGRLSVARCYDGWYTNGNVVVFSANKCGDAHHHWHSWNRLAWQKISIYFRQSGHRHWEYVDTIRTDRHGKFHARIPAYRSGTWRVVYKGGHGLKGSSDTDYVKVVR
jgi:hypothetical protein